MFIFLIIVCIGSSTLLLYYEYKKGEMTQDFKSESQIKDISRVFISGSAAKFSVFFTAG